MKWLVLAIALFVPCRYLLPLDANYFVDWNNHQWVIGYFGEYTREHWAIPSELSTPQHAGMATPVFYGTLLYPLLGLPATVFTAGVVIRVAAFLTFLAQYHLVSRALIRASVPSFAARAVACMTIWAIYPLTNLYNRGALTEFFATSLLVCALSLLVLLFHADNPGELRRRASQLGLALVLAAGTHPITALFAVPVFATLGILFWWLLRDQPARLVAIARALVPWVVLAAVCLAPWVYATAAYSDALAIRHAVPEVVVDAGGLDHWMTRFYPVAYDRRVTGSIAEVSTPYLDAQVSLPLAILFAALAAVTVASRRGASRDWRVLAALTIPTVLFIVFTALSLSRGSYDYLPSVAVLIQFAYRAVTYQNLALLLGIFLLAMVAVPAGTFERPALKAVLAGCVALAAAGAIVKWPHIEAVQTTDGNPRLRPTRTQRNALSQLPPTYYGHSDYATVGLFTALPPDERPAVVLRSFELGARQLGVAPPIDVEVAAPTWIGTNVQTFPWNAIMVDGRRVPSSELRVYDETRLAVQVPAGAHRISYQQVPAPTWRILRALSLLALFGWCGFVVIDRMRAAIVARRAGCLPSR